MRCTIGKAARPAVAPFLGTCSKPSPVASSAREASGPVAPATAKVKPPKLSNVSPELLQREAGHDPGNQYGVIDTWGAAGIGYDAVNVSNVISNLPADSRNLVFDPAIPSRLRGCGDSVPDGLTDMVSAAFVNEDPRNGPCVCPAARVRASLQAIPARSTQFTHLLNRPWTRFMTGH